MKIIKKIKKIFVTILCSFVPNKHTRHVIRMRLLQPDLKEYIEFCKKYSNMPNAKIKICLGGSNHNVVITLDKKWAYKIPLATNGYERSERDILISNTLRTISPIKIPYLEAIKYKDKIIRKYEYANGKLISEISYRDYKKHKDDLAKQIAEFIYKIGISDLNELKQLKPDSTQKPLYMNGWFHGDLGGNFLINPQTFEIEWFIDWEKAAFQDFNCGLQIANRYWKKFKFDDFLFLITQEYNKLFYKNDK